MLSTVEKNVGRDLFLSWKIDVLWHRFETMPHADMILLIEDPKQPCINTSGDYLRIPTTLC